MTLDHQTHLAGRSHPQWLGCCTSVLNMLWIAEAPHHVHAAEQGLAPRRRAVRQHIQSCADGVQSPGLRHVAASLGCENHSTCPIKKLAPRDSSA